MRFQRQHQTEEITKLISFIYSIPCSNAFTEDVLNHMKHAVEIQC